MPFPEPAVSSAADQLHENWREAWRAQNGDKPRWKPMKPESAAWVTEHPDIPKDALRVGENGAQEINIAALPNRMLPPQFAGENVASAKGAIEAIQSNPKASIDEVASVVHDQWLARNSSWAADDLKVPYAQLAEAEKEKDRVVVRAAQKAMEEYPIAGQATAIPKSVASTAKVGEMSSAFTGETIRHSDGVDYQVLDTSRVNFETEGVALGKKTKPTLVRVAKAGEEIVTNPGAVEESRTVAKGGEMIFINRLPDGKEDAFIPRDGNGVANGQHILDQRYELVGGDVNGEGAIFRPKGPPSKLLHEAVDRPTVIKDAWGPGQHQFLDKGATLKSENGRVTGIDKAAFDETWSLTDQTGQVQAAQKIDPGAAQQIDPKRLGEKARSGRPGQDFGPQATDMETGRPVDDMGQRANPKPTVQERVAMRENMAATNSPPVKDARVNAVEEGVSAAPKVAQEAEAVAQAGGRMEAIKGALQADVGQLLKSASKTVGAKLATLTEAAEPVLKPLAKVAAPIVKVGAEIVERSATPIAVGAVVYETATAPKEKKVQTAVTGGAELTSILAVPAIGVPVAVGKGMAGVIREHGIDDVLRREDQRMSQQSVDLKHAKSMAYRFHEDLVAKGASFGEHWSLDLGNDRNRQLLKKTLSEKSAELEQQRDASRPWFSFGKAKERYEDLNSDLNSVNAALGELQNHELARKAGAGLTDAMQRRDALALASGSTGITLSFNEHSGDPLPPSVPGGTGGRFR